MKKSLLIFALLLISISCSKNSKSPNLINEIQEDEIAVQPVVILSTDGFVFSGTLPNLVILEPSSNVLNFGSIAQNSGISKYSFPIQNPSYGSVLKGGSIPLDISQISSPYSVKCFNGLTELASEISCNTITLKKGGKSLITVSLDSTTGLTGIIPDQVLKVNNIPMIIKSTITSLQDTPAPTQSISITIPSTSLVFENVDPTIPTTSQVINVQSSSKIKTTTIISPPVGSVGTKGFKVVSNTCLVAFKGSCQININFDDALAVLGSSINDSFKINDTTISLQANTVVPPSSKIMPVQGVSDIINLGVIYLNEAMPSIPQLKFKVNSLSSSYREDIQSIQSDSLGLNVINNCAPNMNKNATCLVPVSLVLSKLVTGQFVANVTITSNLGLSKPAQIIATILSKRNAVACTINDALANGVNPTHSNNSVSGSVFMGNKTECVLADTACNSSYYLSPDKKSCLSQEVACTLSDAQANGWNLSGVIDVSGMVSSGNVSNCTITSCESGLLLDTKRKKCKESVPKVPGYMLVSLLNEEESTIKQECSFPSPNGQYQIALLQNVYGNYDVGMSFSETECNNSFSPIFDMFLMGDISSNIDQNGDVICSNIGVAFKLTSNQFHNDFQGSCSLNNTLSTKISMRSMNDITSVKKIIGSSPQSFVGYNNIIYMTTQEGGLYQRLRKITLSSSDDDNEHVAPVFHGGNTSSYNKVTLVSGKIYLKSSDNGQIYILNPIYGTITLPNVACRPDCSLASDPVQFAENDAFLIYSNSNGTSEKYVYRTTDGVSFQEVFRGNLSHIPLQSNFTKHNHVIYYTNGVNELMKFNLVAKTIETMSIKAKLVARLGANIYTFDTVAPFEIHKIDVNESVSKISEEIKPIGISTGTSVIYVLTDANSNFSYNYTTGDYNLHQINNNSTTLNLVKEKLVESNLCEKHGLHQAFVNKLSDSFIYGCQKANYSYELRKINYLQGDQSSVISGMSITSSSLLSTAFADYSWLYKNRFMEYKNKIYFVAIIPYLGGRLTSIDSLDQVSTDSTFMQSGNEADYYVDLMVFNDQLFFSGRRAQDFNLFPASANELYKLYIP